MTEKVFKPFQVEGKLEVYFEDRELLRKITSRVYLVSCVKSKLDRPAPARELYAPSHWFRLARAYVELTGDPWFILSAKYGLVHPDQVIEPYELTLNTMDVAQRRAWADGVIAQMADALPDVAGVTILAGLKYREFLVPYLFDRYRSVYVPMLGQPMGTQRSWLGKQVRP